MKKCELCQLPARLYCESDEASLCAGCDLKVHEANFLVARHSRTLLCKTCQSPTPWKASGARLGNTVTECDKCVESRLAESEGVVDEAFTDDEVFGEEDDTSDSDDDAEEEGENQVVPWSSSPTATSSSADDATSFSSSACACRKRMRVNDADRGPQNGHVVSNKSRRANADSRSVSSSATRQLDCTID